ncbi:hypothetical protein CI610_02731 [invertebrate metagenome]|uniref:Core-binding (CB) domain-containing protein n=1 Tax=invertebrate metagenome TaxID=1711999 RepID=A0A2H9T531_9ZZZZ
MEGDHGGRLGLVCGQGGARHSAFAGSAVSVKANLFSSSRGSRKGFGSPGGSKDHACQGRGRGGTFGGVHPRLLFQNVSGTEKVRGVAPDHRSKCLQQARRFSSLQDGDSSGHNRLRERWNVGHFNRFEGCLLPHPHQEIGTEVPPVHLQREGLSVPGHAIRAHDCTFGVYQAAAGGRGIPAFSGNRCSHLFRRFPHASPSEEILVAGHPIGPETLPKGRFHSIQGEVGGDPISGFRFPGKPFQHGSGHCPSTNGEVRESQGSRPDFHRLVSGPGALVSQFPGISQLPGRCGPLGETSHQTSPDVPSWQLGPFVKGLGSLDSSGPVGQGVCPLVDPSGQRSPWGSFVQARSHYDPVHGCFHDGLGGVPRRALPVGGVVWGTALRAHQRARDEVCSIGIAVSSGDLAIQGDLCGYGQLNSCRVSGEAGGYQVPHPVCPRYPCSSSVPGDAINYPCQASSGQIECVGGYSVQAPPTGVDGMATESFDFRGSLSGVGQTSHRSVRHIPEQSVANVCLSGSRSEGLGRGRSISGLGGDACLCIPPLQFGGQGVAEVSEASLLPAPDSTPVAEAALVSGAFVVSGGRSSDSPTQNESPSPASVQDDALSSRDTPPSRVEAISGGLAQAGFSRDVSTRIARSIRSSSSAVYQSRWKIFCDWCVGRKVDPVKASVQLIADFLLWLFRDRNLAPGTIAGYRTAIASVLSFQGRSEMSSSSSLSALIRGFGLDRPRIRQLAPQWNLALVLDSLTRAPYEPLESATLKFLTFKVVFLIALASGRRRSEIHALSSHPSCLRWARNFSAVTLLTDPAFLAKNQVPGFLPEPIKIPSLQGSMGSVERDKLLCPCRALRFYLEKTKGGRGTRSRLFLSIKQGQQEISSQSISRWICQVIKFAYDHSDDQVQARYKVRAHEVRALATSWALLNGSSFQDVMSAAFWRGQNTFTDFYLRSLASHSDGLYSLGPVVVAQSVAVPPQ